MDRIIFATRYLALIGVVSGVAASATAFVWGGYKTVALAIKLARGELDGMALGLAQTMDALLIAAALLLFALGLYSIFVDAVELPGKMGNLDLDALKSKLASIVVIVMAVSFLERLESQAAARDVLYTGVGVTGVSLSLVLLMHAKRDG